MSSAVQNSGRIVNISFDYSVKKNSNLQEIQEKVGETLIKLFNTEEQFLLEALPAAGKTHGTFKATQQTGKKILYLTSRNKLKGQAKDVCDSLGLGYKVIPSPHNNCPIFQGKHGEKKQDFVRKLYSRGISGKELHIIDAIDMPCDSCPYIHGLNELEESLPETQILIGNPKQAYNGRYLKDRIVVKDEFSANEFETTVHNPKEIVNRFCETVKTDLPFHSFEGILEIRETYSQDDLLTWYAKYGAYRDRENALRPEEYHVNAPFLAYFLLYAKQINERWEYLKLSSVGVDHPFTEKAVAVRDRKENTIHILNPPVFESATGFVGLDGTPVMDMWQTSIGLNLEHIEVIPDTEKKEYVNDVLNHEIIQTNESPKPYYNSTNITVPKDGRLIYSILQEEDEKPALITSKKAIRKYEQNQKDILNYVDNSITFANVLSRNDFQSKNIGVIVGMPNYGDKFLEKWAAYQGQELLNNDERGKDRRYWYSDSPNDRFHIHPYYRNLLLQAVFRFGRNGNEQTKVYVHSSGLPDWIPTQECDIDTQVWTETMRVIFDKIEQIEPTTAKELANKSEIPRRTVDYNLKKMNKLGTVKKEESNNPFEADEWYVN